MTSLIWLISIISSYLFGSIPTAYLVGKCLRGADIRELGSGNIGATNAYRVFGKGIGFFVLTADFFKGFLPVFLAAHLFGIPMDGLAVQLGVAAILGHIFNPFFGFNAGKGIATGAGVVCAVSFWLFLIAISVWAITILIFRYSSLSSVLATASLFPMSRVLNLSRILCYVMLFLLILALWSHRSNLEKLIKGNENKLN